MALPPMEKPIKEREIDYSLCMPSLVKNLVPPGHIYLKIILSSDHIETFVDVKFLGFIKIGMGSCHNYFMRDLMS